MKLRNNELKVYYLSDDVIDEDLENDIAATLLEHGYTLYASGTEMSTRIRDLAFERME